MIAESTSRRIRGAVGNAVAWAAGWFALGLAVCAGFRVTGILPALSPGDAVVVAAKMASIGGVAGIAFSVFIGLVYHGRRVSDLRWAPFGVAGGLVSAVYVPALLSTLHWLAGEGFLPVSRVLGDALWAAAFGGIVAGGSLRLAQRGEVLPPVEGGRLTGRSTGVERPA